MNILVTGCEGFVGKNLLQWLKQKRPDDIVLGYDRRNADELADLCAQADFVFHLAGANRPADDSEFGKDNTTFTETLLGHCKAAKAPPIVFSSSAQAQLDNPYGKSKKAAEDAVFAYGNATGNNVFVYRLPGIFGKWCRPNYNSVVATFCHNIARDMPIEIRDPEHILHLVYVDDVCKAFLAALDGECEVQNGFCAIRPVHETTLGALADTLCAFRQGRNDLSVPMLSNALERKLYSTYKSYLPDFSYPLVSNIDERGSFTEFLKSTDRGQVSINVTKPGITKGNHWHHTKTEKFLVVSGQGKISFRKVGETEIAQYNVCGDSPKVIDIPPGYVHSIANTGPSDLVTVMWADEIFDPQNPDTFFEEV